MRAALRDVPPRRRIWVICEGKHEHDGSLLHLIGRIIPNAAASDFDFESWKNPRGRSRMFRANAKGDGVFKKFIATLFDAQMQGYDCVIALIDRDCDRDRVRSVTRAQDEERFPIPRAFGVAVEAFDAWFLADEKALSQVFGMRIDAQPDPEGNRDPKAAMTSLRDNSGVSLGLADCYSSLAEIIDLDLLSQRCSKGFATWRTRVADL